MASPTMPTWATVVFRVGVPSAIALFLVYRLTITLDDRLDRLGDHLQEQSMMQEKLQLELQVHMQNSAIAIHLARRLCVNTAKNEKQEEACWSGQ